MQKCSDEMQSNSLNMTFENIYYVINQDIEQQKPEVTSLGSSETSWEDEGPECLERYM
jgi:hypothetical protein